MTMEDEKDHEKSTLAKLEEHAIRMLWSFVERDAGSWRFWIKVATVMFLVTGGPAIMIHLFFLGPEYGYAD